MNSGNMHRKHGQNNFQYSLLNCNKKFIEYFTEKSNNSPKQTDTNSELGHDACNSQPDPDKKSTNMYYNAYDLDSKTPCDKSIRLDTRVEKPQTSCINVPNMRRKRIKNNPKKKTSSKKHQKTKITTRKTTKKTIRKRSKNKKKKKILKIL